MMTSATDSTSPTECSGFAEKMLECSSSGTDSDDFLRSHRPQMFRFGSLRKAVAAETPVTGANEAPEPLSHRNPRLRALTMSSLPTQLLSGLMNEQKEQQAQVQASPVTQRGASLAELRRLRGINPASSDSAALSLPLRRCLTLSPQESLLVPRPPTEDTSPRSGRRRASMASDSSRSTHSMSPGLGLPSPRDTTRSRADDDDYTYSSTYTDGPDDAGLDSSDHHPLSSLPAPATPVDVSSTKRTSPGSSGASAHLLSSLSAFGHTTASNSLSSPASTPRGGSNGNMLSSPSPADSPPTGSPKFSYVPMSTDSSTLPSPPPVSILSTPAHLNPHHPKHHEQRLRRQRGHRPEKRNPGPLNPYDLNPWGFEPSGEDVDAIEYLKGQMGVPEKPTRWGGAVDLSQFPSEQEVEAAELEATHERERIATERKMRAAAFLAGQNGIRVRPLSSRLQTQRRKKRVRRRKNRSKKGITSGDLSTRSKAEGRSLAERRASLQLRSVRFSEEELPSVSPRPDAIPEEKEEEPDQEQDNKFAGLLRPPVSPRRVSPPSPRRSPVTPPAPPDAPSSARVISGDRLTEAIPLHRASTTPNPELLSRASSVASAGSEDRMLPPKTSEHGASTGVLSVPSSPHLSAEPLGRSPRARSFGGREFTMLTIPEVPSPTIAPALSAPLSATGSMSPRSPRSPRSPDPPAKVSGLGVTPTSRPRRQSAAATPHWEASDMPQAALALTSTRERRRRSESEAAKPLGPIHPRRLSINSRSGTEPEISILPHDVTEPLPALVRGRRSSFAAEQHLALGNVPSLSLGALQNTSENNLPSPPADSSARGRKGGRRGSRLGDMLTPNSGARLESNSVNNNVF